MKKAILATVIGLSAATTQAELFVAGVLGSTSSEVETEATATNGFQTFSASENDTTDSSSMIALSIGQAHSNYRIYGEYANTTYEEADISFITANADYLYGINEVATLYAGLGIGVATLSWKETDETEALGLDGETASSGALGFKFGGLIKAGQGQVEIGYRQFSSNLETEVTSRDGSVSINSSATFTSTSGAYVGYALSF